MVGGAQEDFDAAYPLFEALGTTIVRCGPHGAGQTVKAANQLIVAVNLQACAEAVVFLEKSGVDLTAALEVLGGGLAGSTVLARKKTNFLTRDFTPGFRIDLHHKDMGIVTDAARTVGAALPVGTLVGPYRTRTARATAAPATRDGGSGTPVAGPLRLAPHARHAGSGQSSPAIRACKCSSCQPSACNSALRMVPSSRKPAFSATRQDAGLATECESRSRCRPSSCMAHRLIRTVADTASPRPRPAGSSQ